jgi:hypothetical protein
MVESDHNQPVQCNALALFRLYSPSIIVRTNEMSKSLYLYYMD